MILPRPRSLNVFFPTGPCTVNAFRRSIIAAGRYLAAEIPTLDSDLIEMIDAMLDASWEGSEPRPSHHEVMAVCAFTNTACDPMDDHACELAHLYLLMLSLPDPIRDVMTFRPVAAT